jgi:hypothetical protein
MFPGLTTRLSESLIAAATTISPMTDIIHVTDTTSTTVVTTIIPPYAGFSGILVLINRSGGNVTTLTTGNIATAVTLGQNVSIVLVYSMIQNKWYPGALA